MEQEKNWHYMETFELERIFKTSSTGLSDAEAARRTRARRNRIWQVRGDTVGKYAARSLLDPSAVLLLLSVIVAAFYGEGAIAASVFILMLCAKTAQILAFTVADTMLKRSTEGVVPKARVVREGSVREIPAEAVAEGDMVILDSGDIVPCDVRLTAAESVLAAENLPGGGHGLYIKNADPINSHLKDVPIEMRSNMLYAGSTVVYGFCMGIAVATGKRTLRVSRDGVIELSGGEAIPVLDKLSEWSRICRLVLVGVAFAVTIIGVVFGQGLINAFLSSFAMASACMSEFLAAFGALTVAFSLSASYKKEGGIPEKTNFRCASQIEDAAHADVLLLRSASLIKNGISSLHSFYIEGKSVDVEKEKDFDASLLTSYAAYAAGIGYDGSGGDETTFLSAFYLKKMRAEHSREIPPYYIAAHKKATDAEAEGLDCSLLVRDGDYYFTAMGDAINVLDRCSKERLGGESVSFSKERKLAAQRHAADLLAQGVKVVAVASRPSFYNSLRRIPVLLSDMCFEGFIAVSEKPEAECAEFIRTYRENGGSVVIFSEIGNEDVLFLRAYDIFKTGDIVISERDSRNAKTLPLDEGSLVVISCPQAADGAAIRYRYIEMLMEKHKCAYVGYGAEDAICMEKTVSFACESPLKRGSGIPQSLRCSANGTVDSKGGGFCGAYRMIKRFRRTLAQIKATLKFLMISQLARAFCLLTCSVFGIVIPSASQLVFLGCVFDLCCAFCAVPAIKENAKGEGIRTKAIPDSVGELLIPAVTGTIIASVSLAAPFLCKWILSMNMMELGLTDKSLSAIMFSGILMALSAVFVEVTSAEGIFTSFSRLSPAAFIPMALSVIMLTLTFLVPGVGEAMNMEFPGFIALAFSLIPLLVSVIFLAAYRAYVKHKYK